MVCLDESPLQLIGEVREPILAAPGQRERVDYEYRRNGTVGCGAQRAGWWGPASPYSRCQHESNRAAQLVGQGMDLGRPSAARAADCLIELPPLPPDAER